MPYIYPVSTLIKNIQLLAGVRYKNKLLRGEELSKLPVLNNAYLIAEEGRIADFGAMEEFTESEEQFTAVIDATGRAVLPAWCDSHTHLVFAASREEEFVDKLKGLSYTEIAAKGGGILNSAEKLSKMSEDALFDLASERLVELMQLGTGAIEVKSGYGLNTEGELKMLRVIQRLKQKAPILIKATFLGAHAYPLKFKEDHKGYIKMIVDEMLPLIALEKLADYTDVFCEQGFFSVSEMETVCNAAAKYGLKLKLHVNQLNSLGGLQKAIELNALTVDHLEVMTGEDIRLLAASDTIGTLLPTAAYFLRLPFQPARALIDSGCAVALASDFNPGSSPSGNMNQVVSMSCIQMKMLPEEAINAATINGAYAMELEEEVGSIFIGKRANLIITKPIPSIAYLPYAFGSNLIDTILVNGEVI
ncbi:MAG TPA: imidazolonepropionase [Lacibacter sp.]|nr:imidazolonepropionase [Lacibacter sp.]